MTFFSIIFCSGWTGLACTGIYTYLKILVLSTINTVVELWSQVVGYFAFVVLVDFSVFVTAVVFVGIAFCLLEPADFAVVC